jgi:hypothetical protein
MRRWLVLLMLAVLPLQLSWAAVAGYCQHEEGPAQGAHFGHHAHEHEHPPASASLDDEQTTVSERVAADAPLDHADAWSGDAVDEGNPLALDEDCAVCHLGCAQPLTAEALGLWPHAPSPQVASVAALHESHITSAPERPDRRLA